MSNNELAQMLEIAARMKAEIEKDEESLASKQEAFKSVKESIRRTLELSGIDNVRANGFLFFTKTKSSVQTPKTAEDKKKLFDYLESQGLFLEIASVNSQTLNSLYKNLSEKAAEEGNLDFTLPGVKPAESYVTLEMRRG